jgi:hypothetical protein
MKLRQDMESVPAQKFCDLRRASPALISAPPIDVAAHRQALRRAVRYRGAIGGVENDEMLRDRNRAAAHGVN